MQLSIHSLNLVNSVKNYVLSKNKIFDSFDSKPKSQMQLNQEISQDISLVPEGQVGLKHFSTIMENRRKLLYRYKARVT